MIAAVLVAVLLTLSVTGAEAQTREVMLRGPSSSSRVQAALHRGYPAVPLSSLRHLGLHGESGIEGGQLLAFGDTILLPAMSPFFVVDGELHHLSDAMYVEGGVLYVPMQFVEEWLPTRYPRRLARDDDGVRALGAEGVVAAGPDAGVGSDVAGIDRGAARVEPLGSPAPETRVVVLDAGHGGRDSGARGPGGVREKDVTLAITLRVAELLRQREGYEVHLTRTTDTLIALFDRPRLANAWKQNRPASLFVSIHANSHRSSSAEGFETFFFSEARTADERAVAERENAVVSYDGEEAVRGKDELGFILSNLRNEYYVRASHDLAAVMQDELAEFHPSTNRGVKQAPFVVLVGAYMPAVIVETAFVSNRREAELLTTDRFQQQLARGIAEAIDRFFEQHEFLWQDDGA